MILLPEEKEIVLYSTEGRALIISTALLAAKTTRSAQGVAVMTLKKKALLARACELKDSPVTNTARYRARTIPATGVLLREEDTEEKQIRLEL